MVRVIEDQAKIICATASEPRDTADQIQDHREGTDAGWSPAGHSVLSELVRHSRPWGRERIRIPQRLRHFLWVLIPIELLWGICLGTTLTGASRCDGPICLVTTLDDHAPLLLGCAALSLTSLIGLAPSTRGLSRCDSREVLGIGIAVTAGGAPLLGVARRLVRVVIVLTVLAAFSAARTATA